jgi:hypothetical protein
VKLCFKQVVGNEKERRMKMIEKKTEKEPFVTDEPKSLQDKNTHSQQQQLHDMEMILMLLLCGNMLVLLFPFHP